ncbi:hypothetical protein ACOMD4_06125 [Streptomyces anulatus]|uniref:hypothetical protein n=1 Tax=Streptomyces anulatus TaxID=1892 RepID=UPI003B7E0D6F
MSTAAHPERIIQAAVDGFKKDPSELVGVMLPETAVEFTYGWTVCYDLKEHIEG